ncbi:MAG: GNAT family N-acetyltransferase [Coriobacteriia bacterium]|nr:GNAT family N-acetyltransferase [Coriobacteriia bacterium]
MPTIRRATEADAEQIARLTRRAFATQCELYGDWTLPPMSDTPESVQASIERGIVLIAETNGALLGSVRGELRDGVCHVGRLVVEPALQGRGIGRLLAEAIELEFPDASRFEIFTGHRSEGSLHLYESLGYARHHTEKVHDGLWLIFLGKSR